MMVRQQRLRPLHARLLSSMVFGVAAATFMACTAGSDEEPTARTDGNASASPASQGVVSEADAQQIVDRFEEVNNQANKTRDEELLATVEGGQVHEQSKADFATVQTWSKDEQKAYGTPFFYEEREYLIPQRSKYVTWFAVKARSSYGDRDWTLLIFDKVGGTYKMVMSLYTDDEAAIPQLSLGRHGFAEAVDPSKQVGELAPADLTSAYQDLYESGGTHAGKKLTSTQVTKNAVKRYQNGEKNGVANGMATLKFFATAPSHAKVYALRTADGGVLTAFPAAFTREALLKPAYRISHHLVPTAKQSALGAAAQSAVLIDEFQGQCLATLSSTGARITAIDVAQVDSQ